MKKRLLPVTLITAMTAAFLAGCGSSAQQSAAGGSTAAASSTSSQKQRLPRKEKTGKPLRSACTVQSQEGLLFMGKAHRTPLPWQLKKSTTEIPVIRLKL